MNPVSALRNRLMRLVTRFIPLPFNHHAAQEYEMDHSRGWIQDHFPPLADRIAAARAAGERWSGPGDGIVHEFFGGDRDAWDRFAGELAGQTGLEVGAGPCGVLAIWWWLKRRIVIDPLIAEYRNESLARFGRTWYTDDMELHAQPAEQPVPGLDGRIDGVIVCRNALDHCERPWDVLARLAAYAAPGCRLLLWTDLWHLHGHDAGHRNITKSPEEFERALRDLGFEIEHRFENASRAGGTVNWGCRARKR